MNRITERIASGAVALLVAASFVLPVSAGPARTARAGQAVPRDGMDLSERLVAGPVVIIGRVTKAGVKFEVEVESVLRGEGVGPHLRIAFRGANLQRPIDEPPFTALEGERAIFVLEPWVDSSGDQPSPDLWQPAIGYRSRIPIPEEGGEALVEAVREIIAAQDDPDFDATRRRMLGWLSKRNPWLIDAALDQAARFALVDRTWIPALVAHALDTAPVRRRLVAEAIGRGFERHRFRPRKSRPGDLPASDAAEDEAVAALRDTLVRLARSDPDPAVRRTAVRFLPVAGVPEAVRLLRAIARDDPSLEVRYEAAAALRRSTAGKPGRSRRGR